MRGGGKMTEKKNLEELCFRFFQDVYGAAFTDEEVDETFATIEEFNQNYRETCRRVNADAKKYL